MSGSRGHAATAARALALGAAIAVLATERPGPWLLPVTAALACVLAWLLGQRGERLVLTATGLSLAVAGIDYLTWRVSVINWAAFYVALPLYLAELHAAAHAFGLHVTMWPRKGPTIEPAPGAGDPPVYVLVPTVDEGSAVLGPTLRAILVARMAWLELHPDAEITVVVCNDGLVAGMAISAETEALAASLGVRCVTRTRPGGAKAGNLEAARQAVGATGRALVAVFDADQQPEPEFFSKTLPVMADPTVGWVQTGQYYRNRDNIVARWADDQQSLFYRVLCAGKSNHDAAFICGTNVVIRASALDEIGGFPTSSVTEDFAASIRLAPRWKSVYLDGVLATGLGPTSLNGYMGQQSRWARGTLTVLRTDWPALVLPRRRGLSMVQRVQYALAATHYLCGLRDLVFFLTPIIFALTGISGVRGATLPGFLEHFLPYYGLSGLGFFLVARRRSSLRGVLIGFLAFPVLALAALRALVGWQGRFTVTAKNRVHARSSPKPYLLGVALCLGAIGAGAALRQGARLVVAEVWLAYLAALLSVGAALALADGRGLASIGDLPALAWARRAVGALRTLLVQRPLRRAGVVAASALVVAGSSAGAVLASNFDGLAVAAPPSGMPATRLAGVSGLGLASSLRIDRSFDTAAPLLAVTAEVTGAAGVVKPWMRAAIRARATLWVTLLFSHDGRATLDSSLTAIANGLDDPSLWTDARAFARYRRPVYLSVLPDVDRNFALSSAVARGGIPEDVRPAWAHIRAVFRDAGATNVAFVWEPADPGSDRRFSPPPAAIDAVAVTLFEYPGTDWTQSTAALDAAAREHPGKPLLILASAAGEGRTAAQRFVAEGPSRPRGDPGPPEVTKAAWLDSLARAVARRGDVAGVVYAEGGPLGRSTPSTRAWSAGFGPGARRAVAALLRARSEGSGRPGASAHTAASRPVDRAGGTPR